MSRPPTLHYQIMTKNSLNSLTILYHYHIIMIIIPYTITILTLSLTNVSLECPYRSSLSLICLFSHPWWGVCHIPLDRHLRRNWEILPSTLILFTKANENSHNTHILFSSHRCHFITRWCCIEVCTVQYSYKIWGRTIVVLLPSKEGS